MFSDTLVYFEYQIFSVSESQMQTNTSLFLFCEFAHMETRHVRTFGLRSGSRLTVGDSADEEETDVDPTLMFHSSLTRFLLFNANTADAVFIIPVMIKMYLMKR